MTIPQIPLVIDTKLQLTFDVERITTDYEEHDLHYIRHNNKKAGRFKCALCKQIVNLHAVTDRTQPFGHKYHFQHSSDVECDWKSDRLSKSEIYRGVTEGRHHKAMKKLVADTLDKLDGWQVVSVDKNFIFSADKQERRKPDIHAQYQEKDIAIEIQLRSENYEVILGRKQFYQDKGWPLLWLSMENNNLVSEEHENACIPIKQVQKDIAFSNRGNWFVFNDELSKLSLEWGQLYLKAKIYEPRLQDRKQIVYQWRDQTVRFSQLVVKPGECYYQDFFKLQAIFEGKLRPDGMDNARRLISRQYVNKRFYGRFEDYLIEVKRVWPAFNKDQDEDQLLQLFSDDFSAREKQLKQKIVYFFSHDNWRQQHNKAWWEAQAKQVEYLNISISAGDNLVVIEKLLLILGYPLSDYLCIQHSAHIRACHYFYDNKKYQPYMALCQQAIALSPYRECILQSETMKKRLNKPLPAIKPIPALDDFFHWFTADFSLNTFMSQRVD